MFIAIPSQIVLAIVMLSIIIVIGYLDIVYTLFGNITAIFGNNVGPLVDGTLARASPSPPWHHISHPSFSATNCNASLRHR